MPDEKEIIMKKVMSGISVLALAFSVAHAGIALAGDENVVATGNITALDANQGTGGQTNADDWEDMGTVLAGSGSQSADTDGSANTGSGSQNNSASSSVDWMGMDNANSGTGAQISASTNSNGGDRISDDNVIGLGQGSELSTSDLQAAVSGNAVSVLGGSANANSDLFISTDSGFSNMSGINAVAMETGANGSQNVSVNVTAAVSTN
jgi:hypothetical protein